MDFKIKAVLALFVVFLFVSCELTQNQKIEKTGFASGNADDSENITAKDLKYMGSFKVENLKNSTDNYQVAYGINVIAYNPNGNGGKGSLFLGGKKRGIDRQLYACEIEIVTPVNGTVDSMNTASVIQAFQDISNDWTTTSCNVGTVNFPKIAGMTVYNEKLYHSIWDSYNANDDDECGIGYGSTTLSSYNHQGDWYINSNICSRREMLEGGLCGSKYYMGYMLKIPKSWADTYLPRSNKYIGIGQMRYMGAFSYGPALWAIDPNDYSNSNPPKNNRLNSTPLIFYEKNYHDNFPIDLGGKSTVTSATWITAGSKSAVVYFLHNSTGCEWYGVDPWDNRHPTYKVWFPGRECTDGIAGVSPKDPCRNTKGYHGTAYTGYLVFYSTSDLASVAQGSMKPWDIQPYLTINIESISGLSEHTSQCSLFYGMTYDDANDKIYMSQAYGAGKGMPLIHVFYVSGGGESVNTPP